MSQCKYAGCGTDDGYGYMYRDKKGVSTFTGFIQTKCGDIIWIGKDEKHFRRIVTEEDCQFFLKEMKQYD